ncbi:MAG: hypothetical protein AAF799_21780 [Myxococcota bacterium]
MKPVQSSPSCPWSAAVPVRPSRFTSLFAEHEACNVETDFSAYQAFSVPTADAPAQLGFADYQMDPQYPTARRQGAGRAIFYGEHYLKGTGRTPLAINWLNRADTAHATGHMAATGAVRELVISRYLRAKGLEQHIVPCTGLLLATMPSALAKPLTSFYREQQLQRKPCDEHLQAISVKPAGFARWSNLVWLAHQSSGHPDRIRELAWMGEHFARPRPMGAEHEPAVGACTPTSIATELAHAMQRGLESFEAFFRAGVFWGSYHNNFTLDGRFLDLELPLVVGESVLCKHHVHGGQGPHGPIEHYGRPFGEEILFFARQVRLAFDTLIERFEAIARSGISPAVVQFLRQWIAALHRAVGSDHWVRNPEVLRERMVALYRETGAPETQIQALVSALMAREFRGESLPAIAARMTDASFPMLETGTHCNLSIIGDAPGLGSPQAAEERRLLQSCLEELDAITEVEPYLERLRVWLGVIDQEVRPAPMLLANREPPGLARTA